MKKRYCFEIQVGRERSEFVAFEMSLPYEYQATFRFYIFVELLLTNEIRKEKHSGRLLLYRETQLYLILLSFVFGIRSGWPTIKTAKKKLRL